MWSFRHYLAFRQLGTVLIETVVVLFCVTLAVPPDHQSFLRALCVALIFQWSLHLRDIYDLSKTLSFRVLFARLSQAVLLASSAVTLLYYFLPALFLGPSRFILSLILIALFLTLWHTGLRVYARARAPRSNILVIGTGHLARKLVIGILGQPHLRLRVCGFLDHEPSLIGTSIVNPKVLGLVTNLPKIVSDNSIDRVVVELQDRRGQLPVRELLTMKMQGVAIEDATAFYERVLGKIPIDNLKPSWMIFNQGFQPSRSMLVQKWILSFLVSAILLVVFSPAFLVIIALMKLDSRGPVFFRQTRVGQDGKEFTLVKFRSMYDGAERDSGPVWAAAEDSRVTPVGRFLRRTRLDEFPQLWNVLRGDMSLIGPRPERPCFVRELARVIPFYHLRHAVKPGITGWAQINYRYGNSVQDSIEKLEYDLFYIKHMTWLLDSLILFETAKTILVRKGS
jgi:sugar transferase (PEP-CTERM system associated)